MIRMIVAVDAHNGIGNGNELPWPRSAIDMAHFRQATLNSVVLMGANTMYSIGKPLSERANIVYITRDIAENRKGFGYIQGEPDDVIEHIEKWASENDYEDIWIIGGAATYAQFAQFATELYLTRFPGIYECDTYLSQDILDMFPTTKTLHHHENIEFKIMTKEETNIA